MTITRSGLRPSLPRAGKFSFQRCNQKDTGYVVCVLFVVHMCMYVCVLYVFVLCSCARVCVGVNMVLCVYMCN